MLLIALINLYSLIVLAAVLLSWVPTLRQYALAQWIEAATEPVFEKIRKVVPPVGGLDLSPMLLLIALQLLKRLVFF